ncbi:MAG: hypothetical protein AAFX46_05285 [Cyanobacteria bacterium J06636_27]
MRFSPKAFALLMLGVSVSSAMLPTGKVLADPNKPLDIDKILNSISDTASMYVHSDAIPISFQECTNRANKAANLLFSKLGKPTGDSDVYSRLVQTSRVTGFLQCSRHPNGSSYIVGTSDHWLTNGNEAKSLRNRMVRIIRGN